MPDAESSSSADRATEDSGASIERTSSNSIWAQLHPTDSLLGPLCDDDSVMPDLTEAAVSMGSTSTPDRACNGKSSSAALAMGLPSYGAISVLSMPSRLQKLTSHASKLSCKS